MVLVGNKIDLKEEREVSEEQGRKRAEELGLLYFEVSAKTGDELEELFSNVMEVSTEKSLSASSLHSHTRLSQIGLRPILEEEQPTEVNLSHTIVKQTPNKGHTIKLSRSNTDKVKNEACCS